MKLALSLIKWHKAWSHGVAAAVVLKFGARRMWVDTKMFLGLIKYLDMYCSGAYLQRLSSSAQDWGRWLDSRPDRFCPWLDINATDKWRLSEPHHRTERGGEEKIQAFREWISDSSVTQPLACSQLVNNYLWKIWRRKKSLGAA
jgi:hypothetical protein